jgi:hypothetical protein
MGRITGGGDKYRKLTIWFNEEADADAVENAIAELDDNGEFDNGFSLRSEAVGAEELDRDLQKRSQVGAIESVVAQLAELAAELEQAGDGLRELNATNEILVAETARRSARKLRAMSADLTKKIKQGLMAIR